MSFPEEAKGWLLLQYSGLSEEQRAVVLLRTSGDLKFDTLSQAMPSCFPEFTAPKRRSPAAAHYVERRGQLVDGVRWLWLPAPGE